MRIIAVANQKGGVGKTTTTINLAAAISLTGRQCLVIDLDAQGNATTGLGVGKVDSYELSEGLPAPRRTGTSGVDIIAASGTFASPAVVELMSSGLEAGIPDGYDICLIDCPPAMTGLTRAALNCAGEVIVPIQCEYFSLEGLDSVLRVIKTVNRQQNPSLRLLGIVVTMYDDKIAYCTEVKDEVVAHFPGQVMETVIPRSVELSEASSHGCAVTEYAPRSRGSLGYVRLAKEVLNG